MQKIFLSTILFISLSAILQGQHFIGLHKDDVIKKMRETHRNFYNDDSFTNKHFNYLKFIDNAGDQTWLFFLDEDNICTYHKRMSDYSVIDEVTEQLNQKGMKTGVDQWEYMMMGITYTVTLTHGEWFFSVVTRTKK